MYIRRKVFSRFIDEYGDERLFSTTDYEYDDYGYDQRMYASYVDEAGNLVGEDGRIKMSREQMDKAEDLFGGKKGPKSYKAGTANGAKGKRYDERVLGNIGSKKGEKPSYGGLVGTEADDLTKEQRKALKSKVGKRTAEMKNWNKTDAYKAKKYEAGKRAAETKETLGEVRNLKNKLGNAKALNKGLLIGIGAAGIGAAGYGAYKYAKARKAKKEQEEKN